ncbi:MAG: DMT family transporter, partial [Candidatus Bathyarchaeia archaeon]
MRLRNWLLFLLMVFLWGSNWSVMKMGLDFIPPITFVLLRFLFSALSLSPFLFLLRREFPRDKDTLRKLLLLCLVNALGIAATNLGLVFEESGMGAVLTYTQPLFVFCLAALFLKEEVKTIRLLGLIIGFMGVAVLFLREYGSLTALSYPDLMMLLG